MHGLTHPSGSNAAAAPAPAPTGFRRVTEWIAGLFPRNAVSESVSTRAWFDATPEEVWQGIVFYEDVPGRAHGFLRLFLPAPIRTEGGKTVGSVVRCSYENAFLIKRITVSEPGVLLAFDVIEQRLGVENGVTLGEGSYAIAPAGKGCDVVLTTHYRGQCRPRFIARLLERRLAHGLHRFILRGMRAKIAELRNSRAVIAASTGG